MYLGARNREKGEKTIHELKMETGKEGILLELDLSDLKSVKAAAEEFQTYVMRAIRLRTFPDPSSLTVAKKQRFICSLTMRGCHFYRSKKSESDPFLVESWHLLRIKSQRRDTICNLERMSLVSRPADADGPKAKHDLRAQGISTLPNCLFRHSSTDSSKEGILKMNSHLKELADAI